MDLRQDSREEARGLCNVAWKILDPSHGPRTGRGKSPGKPYDIDQWLVVEARVSNVEFPTNQPFDMGEPLVTPWCFCVCFKALEL